MKRAAIYARQSKDDERSYSIETQVADCREFAGRNDLDVTHVFDKDVGRSGADRQRPDLLRMLDAAKAGEFEVLLVRDTDRLARDAEFALNLSNVLNQAGVQIFPVMESIRDTAGEDRFTYGIHALVAEQERDRTRRRMMRGKKASAEAGHFSGGQIPYGLRSIPCDRHDNCNWSILVLDDDEVSVLRDVWSWIVDEGASGREAARRLNEDGRLPTRTGTPWTRQLLRGILTNPRLMGQASSWGVDQDWPQVYTPSEFARLQRALKVWSDRYRNTGDERMAYPLSGRIICGCGMHWTGGVRRGKRWYRCSQHPSYWTGTHPKCEWTVRRWINADEIEAAVSETLREHLHDGGAIWGAVIDYLTDQTHDPAELSRARLQVDKLEDKLAALYGRINDLDAAAFKKATTPIEEQLESARDRVSRLESLAVVNLTAEAWSQLSELNEAKQRIDTSTWSGLVELGIMGGGLLNELRSIFPVDDLVALIKRWLGAQDLDRILRELDVKVHLTGKSTFDLDLGIDIGASHVRTVAQASSLS